MDNLEWTAGFGNRYGIVGGAPPAGALPSTVSVALEEVSVRDVFRAIAAAINVPVTVEGNVDRPPLTVKLRTRPRRPCSITCVRTPGARGSSTAPRCACDSRRPDEVCGYNPRFPQAPRSTCLQTFPSGGSARSSSSPPPPASDVWASASAHPRRAAPNDIAPRDRHGVRLWLQLPRTSKFFVSTD